MTGLYLNNSNLRKFLIYLFIPLVWIIPGLILYLYNIADPYMYINLTPIELESQQQHVGFQFASGIGYKVLILSLIEITEIDTFHLVSLPIGSLLLPLICFCVTRTITNFRYAVLSSIFIAYFYSFLLVHFNAFVYLWTYILVFISILLVFKYLKTGKKIFSASLFIIFSGNIFIYHSTPAWIAILFGSAAIMIFFINRIKIHKYPSMMGLTFASIILYLLIETHFYTHFVLGVSSLDFSNPIEQLSILIAPLFGNLSYNNPYQIPPGQTNLVAAICTIIIVFMLLMPFLFGMIRLSSKLFGKRKLDSVLSLPSILMFSIFSIFIAHIIGYYLESGFHISYRPAAILFPSILPIAITFAIGIKNIEINKNIMKYFGIMVILVIIGFFAFQSSIEQSESIENTVPCVDFIYDYCYWEDSIILTDLSTYGKISLILAKNHNMAFESKLIDLKTYEFIVGDRNIDSTNIDYIALFSDNFNIPLSGIEWDFYRPIDDSVIDSLYSNKQLNNIYNEGSNIILSPVFIGEK